MKKISVIIATALAFILAGCQVENQPAGRKLVEKTFSVLSADTRTALDGMDIKWAAGDEINVIGVNSAGTATSHPFTLQSGAGSKSAVFKGEVNDDETSFYAIYPNLPFDATKFANGYLVLKNALGTRSAVKDGFDSSCAVMMAKEDGSGNLPFVHCMAYIKIKINEDDVNGITITSSGSARFNGKPSFTLASMANNTVESANATVTASGSFLKGETYYIPVTVKASSLKNITVKYSFSDSTPDQSLVTEKLSSVTMVAGAVYDFGCPPISKPTGPSVSLNKTSVSDVEPDAASGLQIADAYAIANGTDTDITVTTDGTVVTAASVSAGTVTYTVSENTGTARKGWIGLQAGSEEVKKIEVNQKGSAAIVLTTITTTTTWGASDWAAIATAYSCDGVALQQDFIFNNLGFVNGSGSGFKIASANGQLQLAGSGAAGTKCCVQFKIGGEGTVTIKCRSANKTAARNLKIALGTTEKGQITAPAYEGTDPVTESVPIYNVTSGDLLNIYSANSGINIYEITWTPKS